jgi:alpha-galactosidase
LGLEQEAFLFGPGRRSTRKVEVSDKMNKSRRAFLGSGMAAVAAAHASKVRAAEEFEFFSFDIIRPPDFAAAYVEGAGRLEMSKSGDRWQAKDVEVTTSPREVGAAKTILVSAEAPHSALERLHLRWLTRLPMDSRFLGDHWERSYGDLEWRGFAADRVMPWYSLVATGKETHGYGVKTGARTFCFWQVDAEGISLWLDMRNGGSGVRLGERRLEAAEVVAVQGSPDLGTFAAARALCRALCAHPRLPPQPVYGSNNWYYLYGQGMTAENVMRDVEQLAELSPLQVNRPFMVIDEGWGKARDGAGPWTEDNLRFPEVPNLTAEMKKRGVRPGIWVRPLLTVDPQAKGWKLAREQKPQPPDSPFVIDPSRPEVLAYIQEGLRRVTGWGFELVKHDFSTYDILGRWGMRMGEELTDEGWHFADRSKTSAEIILQLYRALREAVGDAVLLGCNTMGHLGAGIFEVQRTGDDTSGRNWNRTRKMGVNTLAFRLPQHRTFFLLDPDCAPMTRFVPMEMTRQWLDLVARSGTVLFVSADPATVSPSEKDLLKNALAQAARVQPEAAPVGWMDTMFPDRWLLDKILTQFSWFGKEGVDPFPTKL